MADGDRWRRRRPLAAAPTALVRPVLAAVNTAKSKQIIFSVSLDTWLGEEEPPAEQEAEKPANNALSMMMSAARQRAGESSLPPEEKENTGEDRLYIKVCPSSALDAALRRKHSISLRQTCCLCSSGAL